MITTNADATEIARALSLLMQPADVHELRALDTSKATQSGYFTDREKMAAAAAMLSGRGQVYVSLNPTIADLLARANNRLKPYSKSGTTDNEIAERRWFGVDCDPKRPRDIPSTDDEHMAALERAREILDWLSSLGWPEPIEADSGNGGHLLYRVDLPNDDASRDLLSRCLQVLELRFGDDVVDVDQKTANAARVWRLYGTMNCKGDGTADRPRRIARILQVPGQITPVTTDQLQALAARLPNPPRGKPGLASLEVAEWLRKYGIEVAREAAWQGGRKWILDVCPFNSEHADRAAFVLQFANGAIAAGCHHNSCAGKGWRDLRLVYEPGARAPRTTRAGTNGRSGTGSITEEPADEGDDRGEIRETDLGNARRLVLRHGRDLRYCHPWRSWLIWDGTRWTRDDTGAVSRLAKETIQSIYVDAAASGDETERKALARHAMRSEAEPRIRAMIALAESEPGVPIRPDDLDGDPWLLNVLNGTVDLRTGKLREHKREDLITKLARVSFDQAAECPVWTAFLYRIMDGNDRLIGFLRRAIGYSLTGLTWEEVLLILWGPGDNGKTTLLELLLEMFGDYAAGTPAETFVSRRDGTIPNDVARLKGIRLVKAVETDSGRRLAEARVKQMTGRDTISARFMRGEWFDFKPEFTAWLATNHKPEVRGTDKAIWDRIRLVPFTVTIPEAEQDRELADKLRAELPGILCWAVEGCLEWLRDGLGAPQEVLSATETYRAEQDTIANFIDDACIVGEEKKATAKALYAAYRQWCQESGEEPMGKIAFGTKLGERGFTPSRTGRERWWRGIGLVTQPGLDQI